MKKWIYIALLTVCGQKLVSQNNCDNIIEDGTDLFNSGNYDECINILENGLNTCSLSKSKKESAYILLINSNIEKDSLPGIDKNFNLLLKNSPTYSINDYSGIDDFEKYFNNYYVYPKLSIGIRVPRSFVKIIPIKYYSVIAGANNNAPFIATTDFKYNTFIDYRINKNIALFTDISAFGFICDRDLEAKYNIVYSEEQATYLQLDFGAKYFFKVAKKISLYAETGFSNTFLLNSKLTLNRTDIIVEYLYPGVDETKYFTEKAGFNSKSLRNPYVYSVFLGVGAIYRFGPLGVGFDTRVYNSLNTLNKISSRTSVPAAELIRDYNYIDSDMRIMKFDASIIVTYSWFKVERKKIVRD